MSVMHYAKCDQNIMDGETDEYGGFEGIRFFLNPQKNHGYLWLPKNPFGYNFLHV